MHIFMHLALFSDKELKGGTVKYILFKWSLFSFESALLLVAGQIKQSFDRMAWKLLFMTSPL